MNLQNNNFMPLFKKKDKKYKHRTRAQNYADITQYTVYIYDSQTIGKFYYPFLNVFSNHTLMISCNITRITISIVNYFEINRISSFPIFKKSFKSINRDRKSTRLNSSHVS